MTAAVSGNRTRKLGYLLETMITCKDIFRVDELGLDIIAAAKSILIRQQKVMMGESSTENEDMKIQYKALQNQVRSLEQKIDILLKKLL